MEKIKSIREALNLKQNEFSNELGVTQSYLSAMETGRKHPTTKLANILFKKFNVSPEWFYNDNGNIFNITMGNTDGVNDGVNGNAHTQDAHLSTHPTNEKSNSSFDSYDNQKKVNFFWNMVKVYDKEFDESFEDYSRLEELLEHLSHYFTNMSDIINEFYAEIQNTDNETLREPAIIKNIVSGFINKLPSIKENHIHFNELSEQLIKSNLIEPWVKKLPHLNPNNNLK